MSLNPIDGIAITGLLFPQTKVERADEHLVRIQAALEKFKRDPYLVSSIDDQEAGFRIVQIRLKGMERVIPVLIGELAYSLRSALDHLAWQLALVNGRTPTRACGFPITDSTNRKDRKNFNSYTGDIGIEAVEVIRSLQPACWGEGFKSHPLWQLNKLSNLDKHETVAISHTRRANKAS